VKTLPIGRNTKTLVAPYLEPLVPVTDCPNKRNEINREVIKTGQYPITRRLFVIIKENGQLDEQAGNAYAQLLLTDQGQTLISKAGFVKIR
jgi:phosphate transport system substrate-binding protein